MKSFKVFAHLYIPYEVIVEANDVDHAYQIAKELDGGDFIECGDIGFNGEWTVSPNGIYEVTEGDSYD